MKPDLPIRRGEPSFRRWLDEQLDQDTRAGRFARYVQTEHPPECWRPSLRGWTRASSLRHHLDEHGAGIEVIRELRHTERRYAASIFARRYPRGRAA